MGLSRRVAATVAGIMVAVPLFVGGAPQANAATSVSATCAPKITPRQATYNVLGYLFGDGHWSSRGYSYHARTACKAARIRSNLKILGFRYTEADNRFHLPNVAPFNHNQNLGAAPELKVGVANADDIGFFLAGILEGEGSGSGEVFDDPNWGRTAAIVGLYKRAGVIVKPDHPAPKCNCATGPGYWNTRVDPTASRSVYNGYISIIRSWRFADMKRVPNYH
jgi:hypothetical protein